MKLKKSILSLAIAASMLLGATPMTFAEGDTVSLDPRSALGIGDGYIRGIAGFPTVSELSEEFTGDVSVIAPDGKTLGAYDVISSESTVKAGDTVIGKTVIYGDAESDGNVNLTDASAVLKHIAAWENELSVESADVDLSGAVNLSDVSQILKYIAGWEVTLGGEYLIDLSDGYKLLTNDSELDAKLATKVKDVYGVELETITEAGEGDKFITVGRDLSDKYDFIDGSADGLYVDTYDGNVYLTVSDETALDELSDKAIYRGYTGTYADMDQTGALYARAILKIKKTPAVTDGTNGMNGDILAAITSEKFTEPKNIIYMIGDGMGKNITIAAKNAYKNELYGGKLAMNHLPVEGRQSTYSTSLNITDSAAGGTALATGYKTTNRVIGMNTNYSEPYKNLVELAAEKGMSTGIVATKSVTDATPATFTAHVSDRDNQYGIAAQQIAMLANGTLDIALGGGYSYYEYGSNGTALAAAQENGVTYTKNWDEAYEAELPLAGLFEPDFMPTDGTDVHIAQMTELALDRLSQDENGFFLMVEGSRIDSYAHENKLNYEIEETYEFDCAIAVALRFVALNPDTVLVITADHETGELSVAREATPEAAWYSGRYSSTGHHWVDVPVYAIGYGTESLAGIQENTDIAIFLAGLMGEENFGQKSESFELIDVTDPDTVDAIIERNDCADAVTVTEDGLLVNYGKEEGQIVDMYVPKELFEVPAEELDTITTFRVTMTNTNDEEKRLPYFGVKMEDGTTYTIGETITYMAPGETVTYTYNVDVAFRENGSLAKVEEFLLYGTTGYTADLLISDISVVSRPLDK